MKLSEIMTNPVIRIQSGETVAVAARMLTHYNVGALPVCGRDGRLCGVVTDRDIVTRCLASGSNPEEVPVADVMTKSVYVGRPDMEASYAAAIMGQKQIRRLPVMENGKLCGMVSLGDLACAGQGNATAALTEISSGISHRK